MRWAIAWSFTKMAPVKIRYAKLGVVRQIDEASLPDVTFSTPLDTFMQTKLPNESYDQNSPWLIFTLGGMLRQRLMLSLSEQGLDNIEDVNDNRAASHEQFFIADAHVFGNTISTLLAVFLSSQDRYALQITATLREDALSFTLRPDDVMRPASYPLSDAQRSRICNALNRLQVDIERSNRR